MTIIVFISPIHFKDSLCEEIREVANGSFKTKTSQEIVSSGYVVKSLEAALWAFHNTNSFEEGLLKVFTNTATV